VPDVNGMERLRRRRVGAPPPLIARQQEWQRKELSVDSGDCGCEWQRRGTAGGHGKRIWCGEGWWEGWNRRICGLRRGIVRGAISIFDKREGEGDFAR
jgi:hypothetical protein